jgi:hypothetical protein
LPAHAVGILLILSPAFLLACVCLGPVVFGGMVPGSLDIYAFFFQVGLQLRHAYTTGQLPFWSPSSLAGTPFLADPASAVFYLPNILLFRLFSSADAIRATVLLHIFTAYFGTYAFLRAVGVGRAASQYGALSYAFSGFVLFTVQLLPILMVASLLPVHFFLGHQTLSTQRGSGRLLYAAGFAAAVALDVLIGFPQGTYYSLLAVSAYMVALSVNKQTLARPHGLVSYARKLVLWLGIPALIGVALCAIQLLPTLEFVRWTDRAAGYPIGLTIGGLSPSAVWAFLGGGPLGELRTVYTGALGLALAGLALLLRPNRQTVFFAASAILALLLMTAVRNPIRELASLTLPGWRVFEDHVPTRALPYVVFCLAVLAAWALDRPRSTLRWLPVLVMLEMSAILVLIGIGRLKPDAAQLEVIHLQLRLLAILLALNVVLVYVWQTPWMRSRAKHLAVPSLIAVLILDLGLHYKSLGIQYINLAQTFPTSATSDFLTSHATSPSRFLSIARPSDWHRGYLDPAQAPRLLSANAGPVYGLEDVEGYNPLQMSRYREFLRAINNGAVDVDYHLGFLANALSPLVRYLNVKYLVTDAAVPLSARLVGPTEVSPGRTEVTIGTSAPLVRGLVVDSTLGNSVAVPQGTPVGAIIVTGSDGTSTRFMVRAGVHTAEYAYDRPDARQSIQHDRPAAIARSVPAGPDFQGHFYRAIVSFPQPTAVTQLRFELTAPEISWIIDQVTSDSESWRDSYTSMYEHNGVRILQANDVLPRAYLTHSVEQIAEGPAILARLQDPSFDVLQTVVLEEAPYAADAELGPTLTSDGRWMPLSTPEALAETADVQVKEPNQLKVHVSAQRPAMLVLSETFYPAWRAYVDGLPAHIYRANYLFRAVAIPAGEHQVEMRYESASFQLGLLISGGTLIVVLAAGCCYLLYARRRSPLSQ